MGRASMGGKEKGDDGSEEGDEGSASTPGAGPEDTNSSIVTKSVKKGKGKRTKKSGKRQSKQSTQTQTQTLLKTIARYKKKFKDVTGCEISTTLTSEEIIKRIQQNDRMQLTKSVRSGSHFTASAIWRFVEYRVKSRVSACKFSSGLASAVYVSYT
jgi:hypothetical protein